MTRPTWITPQLLIQVLTIVITITAAWVTLGNRLDILQEKLVAIQTQLPNKEVLDLKIKRLEEEQDRIARVVEIQDTWIRNTRERLAEKGWKP